MCSASWNVKFMYHGISSWWMHVLTERHGSNNMTSDLVLMIQMHLKHVVLMNDIPQDVSKNKLVSHYTSRWPKSRLRHYDWNFFGLTSWASLKWPILKLCLRDKEFNLAGQLRTFARGSGFRRKFNRRFGQLHRPTSRGHSHAHLFTESAPRPIQSTFSNVSRCVSLCVECPVTLQFLLKVFFCYSL